jgi:hypothetical protein
MDHLLNLTLELYQPVRVTDAYRSQKYVWPTTPTATFPCRLQRMSPTLDSPAKGTLRQWQVYLPADASVASDDDRVTIDGRWFDVVSVYPVHTPRGLHHIEMVVKNYDGEVPNE